MQLTIDWYKTLCHQIVGSRVWIKKFDIWLELLSLASKDSTETFSLTVSKKPAKQKEKRVTFVLGWDGQDIGDIYFSIFEVTILWFESKLMLGVL